MWLTVNNPTNPQNEYDLINGHIRKIWSQHLGLHPHCQPTKGQRPLRSQKRFPPNVSLGPPRQFESRQSHWPCPPRCGLQKSTRGNGIVWRGQCPPWRIWSSGHQRYRSVGATKTPGALEHLPQTPRLHPHHQAWMTSLHPPRLRGGTLHIPPRKRHLLQNDVTTHAPRPFLWRNQGPRSNQRCHPHWQTPWLLVQQPPLPSIHHDDGGGAEKGQTCRPANHRQLSCGLCHVLLPHCQLIT